MDQPKNGYFRINKYLELLMVWDEGSDWETEIRVNQKQFLKCKRLILNITTDKALIFDKFCPFPG